jgi:hypothetical protein
MDFENPCKMVLHKTINQFIAGMMAIWLAYYAAGNGIELYAYGATQARVLEMSLSTIPSLDTLRSSPGVEKLRIEYIRAGCKLPHSPNVSFSDDFSTFTSIFPAPIEVDGVELRFHSSFQCNMIRFQTLGAAGPDRDLRVMGSSQFRKRVKGIKYIDGYVPCNRTMTFDHRARWPLMLVGVIQPILQAMLFLALSICGLTNRLSRGTAVSVLCLLLLAVIAVISGTGYIILQSPAESIVPFFSSASYLAVALSISLFPSHLIHTIAASSTALLLIRIAIDCALFQDPANLAEDLPWPLLLCLTSSLATLTAQLHRTARARSDARPDQALYDCAWRAAAASARPSGLEPALARLSAAVESARKTCPAQRPRQLNRRLLAPDWARGAAAPEPCANESFFVRRGSGGDSDGGAGPGGRLSDPACGTTPGEPDPLSPVASLDQLYAQAFTASVLLRCRCLAWASASCGRAARGLEVAPSADNDGRAPMAAAAPAFKCPRRAAEKAVTCYGGDVSMLLDVCRCR